MLMVFPYTKPLLMFRGKKALATLNIKQSLRSTLKAFMSSLTKKHTQMARTL